MSLDAKPDAGDRELFDGDPFWTPGEMLGPATPQAGTPELRPGQRRRTSTIDTLRPEGLGGPRLLVGAARDAIGESAGVRALASSRVDCLTDPKGQVLWFKVDGEPVTGLEGVPVGVGFRQRAGKRFPRAQDKGSLLWSMLDDFPTASLVANYVRLRAGFEPPWVKTGKAPKADICSGWRRGGSLVQGSLRAGRQTVSAGPAAPELGAGWHDLSPLPRNGARRRRRLDLTLGEVLSVDAYFRDAVATADAGEDVVVHEYGLRARIDPNSLEVIDVTATPRVLPYVECPAAIGSAERIVGMKLGELRDRVRAQFTGITTCTHLNDFLRSLQDVTGLLAA